MQIGEVPASSMRLDKNTKEQEVQEVQGPNAGALHYLDIKDLRGKKQ